MGELRLVGFQGFGGSGNHLVAVRAIDQAEFENLTEAIAKVFEFSAHQSLYGLCQRNHAELTATWSGFERQYGMSGEFNEAIGTEVSIELNRRLLNYLTTLRTFVDHWKKTLRGAKRAGTDKGYSAKFEKAISDLESQCFEFQFFWQFRNFVQHVGLPDIALSFSSHATSGPGPGIFHFGSARLDRDSLLQSRYDWKGARASLELQAEQIDLFAGLRRLARQLERLNSLCTQANLSWVSTAFDFLLERCGEVAAAAPGGKPGIADLQEREAGHLNCKIKWLPIHLMSEVNSAREKL